MNKIINDMLTGLDGESFDIGRILWAAGVISYIAYGGWHLFLNHLYNPMDYGTGLGVVLAGGGAAIGMKAKTEPGAQ